MAARFGPARGGGLWLAVGTRIGAAELVYLVLVMVILFGANQIYKGGNKELLLTAIDRSVRRSGS